MSIFRKAESAKVGGKFLVFGETGSGKSTFLTTFPSIACIDSEAGLSNYEDNPNLLLVANTNSVYDVEEAISEIEDEMLSEIKTLGIDSETKIYSGMQVSAMEVEEKRARQKGKDIEDSTVSQRGWGRIKLLNQKLQNLKIKLSSIGVHIVSVAQQDDIKEKKGEQYVKVGVKPNMAKGAEYDFDIVLRFFTQTTRDGEVYKAEVLKDRTGVFKKGDIIDNPSYDYWREYYEGKSKLKERKIDFNSDINKDIDKMQDESAKIETLIAQFKTIAKQMPKKDMIKVQKLCKEKGVDNPLKATDLGAMKEIVEFMTSLQ